MNQRVSYNRKMPLTSDCLNKTYINRCNTCQPAASYGIVDIVKDYCSTNILKYSDWIDCASLNKYYYFVKNLGYSDVEAYIEISPDKKLVYTDSDKIVIKSCEVSYFQPLRESRYIRFSYRSISPEGVNLITSWFQAK